MKEHMKLLGLMVIDKVTGFSGICTTISFDLYGCVQAVVMPAVSKEGKQGDGQWFDTKRLRSASKIPVMPVPTFETVPGGAEKPALTTSPLG